MAQSTDDKDIIAKLRSELALREKEIIAKEIELKNASTTFNSVLALKNQKIRDLEAEITRLKSDSEKQKEVATRRDMAAVVAMEGRHSQALDGVKKEIEKLSKMVEKSSLDLKNKLIWTGADTIRATFTDVSKMTGDLVVSRTSNKAGLNSAICVQTHFDKSTKYLSVYLRIQGNYIWSGTVAYCFKLIRTGMDPYLVTPAPIQYTPTKYCWGIEKFISFKDLLNPSNKFAVDDSIRVEISFTAYPIS